MTRIIIAKNIKKSQSDAQNETGYSTHTHAASIYPLCNSYLFIAYGGTVDHLERYKRQLDNEELLNLSPEELCKDRVSEEYFRLTTEGDCRDVVR